MDRIEKVIALLIYGKEGGGGGGCGISEDLYRRVE